MNFRTTCFFLCFGFLAAGGSHAQVVMAPVQDVPQTAPLPPAPPVSPASPEVAFIPGSTLVVPRTPVIPRMPTATEIRAVEAINKDTQLAARIEVWFSGSQSSRFVFEESDSALAQEKGIALRTVGTASIEMGARKASVSVQREEAKPEVFHTRFMVSGGGKLDAVMTLQIGEEKTVSLVGGKPTQVTVKRLR